MVNTSHPWGLYRNYLIVLIIAITSHTYTFFLLCFERQLFITQYPISLQGETSLHTQVKPYPLHKIQLQGDLIQVLHTLFDSTTVNILVKLQKQLRQKLLLLTQ